MEGNIVVDGVLASCYASAHHDVIHFGMRPLVWYPKILEMVVGKDGVTSGYVKITAHLAQWTVPQGFVYGETTSFEI